MFVRAYLNYVANSNNRLLICGHRVHSFDVSASLYIEDEPRIMSKPS